MELYDKLSRMSREERVEYCQALLGQLREYGHVAVQHIRPRAGSVDKHKLAGGDCSTWTFCKGRADPRGGMTAVSVYGEARAQGLARCRPTENFQRHFGIAIAATRLLEQLQGGE